MGDNRQSEEERKRFAREVGRKEQRRLRSERSKDTGVWGNVGLFGIVGWSVAVPTLLFTALGVWIDSRREGQISWTLSFLFVGIVLGSLNAWYWVRREQSPDDGESRE